MHTQRTVPQLYRSHLLSFAPLPSGHKRALGEHATSSHARTARLSQIVEIGMQQRLSPRGPLARHGSGCAPHTRLLASTPLRAAPVPPPQQQQQQLTQERVQLPQERVSTQQRGGDTDRRRPVATRPRTPQARSLLPLTTSSWDEHDHEHNEVVASLAAAAAPAAARPTQQQPQQEAPVARAQLPSPLAEAPMLRAEDAWQAFETQLEKDLVTTLTTLVAIFGAQRPARPLQIPRRHAPADPHTTSAWRAWCTCRRDLFLARRVERARPLA